MDKGHIHALDRLTPNQNHSVSRPARAPPAPLRGTPGARIQLLPPTPIYVQIPPLYDTANPPVIQPCHTGPPLPVIQSRQVTANHSTPISLRLPLALLAAVDRRAHEGDSDRSTVIRECIERHLPEGGNGRASGSVPARGLLPPESADHAAGKAGMPAAASSVTDHDCVGGIADASGLGAEGEREGRDSAATKLARAQRAAREAGLPVKVGV